MRVDVVLDHLNFMKRLNAESPYPTGHDYFGLFRRPPESTNI